MPETRDTFKYCELCGHHFQEKEVARGDDITGYNMVWVRIKHNCTKELKERIQKLEERLENLNDYVSRMARGGD